MSNGSEVLIYLSFLLFLKEDEIYSFFIYKNQRLSLTHFILQFSEQTSRILEPNPQGLISSTINLSKPLLIENPRSNYRYLFILSSSYSNFHLEGNA